MDPDITTTSLPLKPSRRCGKKVRSGCLNCKKRHLKCDEAKPQCKRCDRSLFRCAYQLPATSGGHLKPLRPFLPRTGIAATNHKTIAPPLSPELSPFQNVFQTDQDRNYFSLFWTQLTDQLGHMASYCNPEFWARYIFRECASCECVRRSLIALGALAHPLDSESLPMPNATAVKHHIRAVEIFRGLFVGDRARPMTILVLTIMISTFELLQGNLAMGFKLLNGGVMLLKESVKKAPKGWRPRFVAMSQDRRGVEASLPKCLALRSYELAVRRDLKAELIGLMDMGDEICAE